MAFYSIVIYTTEHLKWHTPWECHFKTLVVSDLRRLKTYRFKSSTV